MGAQTSCCVAVLFRNFLGFLLLLLFSALRISKCGTVEGISLLEEVCH